jgi:sugar phosphate permease
MALPDCAGGNGVFLAQGIPAVLMGLTILRFLPDRPEHVRWLAPARKAWIATALARDAALIGHAGRHDLRTVLANPTVWLLGCTGLLLNCAMGGFVLSAPAVLAANGGLETEDDRLAGKPWRRSMVRS